MDKFAILTNRKRAVIALVHSLVFWFIAVGQMLWRTPSRGMLAGSLSSGSWVLCGIYLIVSGVLFWLFAVSRNWSEKLYFALCTVSATSGLLRTILGDRGFHSGGYIRVIMLSGAVLVGIFLVWLHSEVVSPSS